MALATLQGMRFFTVLRPVDCGTQGHRVIDSNDSVPPRKLPA